MKARPSVLLLAAVAALALVGHKGSPASSPSAAALATQKPPAIPHGLYRTTVADDPTVADPLVGKLGLGRAQQPVLFVRPKAPVFTDIGQVADVQYRDQSIEGAGTANTGLAQLPAVGTALKVQAAVEQVMAAVLGSGNAAGLSQQQLDYACPGGKCAPNALAIAENRLGTKSVLINGDYVQIGGAALGGPGLSDAAAATAEERVSLRAAPRMLLG